jgi:hypothetical protein
MAIQLQLPRPIYMTSLVMISSSIWTNAAQQPQATANKQKLAGGASQNGGTQPSPFASVLRTRYAVHAFKLFVRQLAPSLCVLLFASGSFQIALALTL